MTRDPAPKLDLTGHLHGYALRFGGEEVAIYPSFDGAAVGLRVGREALAQLAATLAKPRTEEI